MALRNASEGFPGASRPFELADPVSDDRLAALFWEANVNGHVNKVSLVHVTPFGDTAVETLEEFMRVNPYPALLPTQQTLPRLSISGWAGFPKARNEAALGFMRIMCALTKVSDTHKRSGEPVAQPVHSQGLLVGDCWEESS